MADYFTQFSEIVPRLTAQEETWLKGKLEIIEGPEGLDQSRIAGELEGYCGCVVCQCEFCDSCDPEIGRHAWLYAECSAELELVGLVMQQFLKQFRPNECWSLTYAATCSKPRVGEFGGGALFVTATEIKWQNSYDFITEQRAAFAGHGS